MVLGATLAALPQPPLAPPLQLLTYVDGFVPVCDPTRTSVAIGLPRFLRPHSWATSGQREPDPDEARRESSPATRESRSTMFPLHWGFLAITEVRISLRG